MIGKCKCCDRICMSIERRRLNTKFVNDEKNWFKSCESCFQEEWEHYADMWSDYYSGCL